MPELGDIARLEGVSVELDGRPVLCDVDARLVRAATTAIIGPNGAGKTTLLRALLGLIPYRGRIRFFAPDGSERAGVRFGYVPQQIRFDSGTPISVLDLMVAPAQTRPVWLGHAAGAREAAMALLSRFGAASLADRPVGRLSGGQQQRVMLALAMRRAPELLLLDEPISGIDVAGEAMFCDLVDELRAQAGITVVLISHDLSIVSRHADRVICLDRRVQCQGPTPEVLTAETLQTMFGLHAGLYQHRPVSCAGHAHHAACDAGQPPASIGGTGASTAAAPSPAAAPREPPPGC